MDDDDKYVRYANIPIPSYDEALRSRPGSSQHHRGPQEISDDAERQGLLGESPSAYRPPTVESARSSIDSDLGLPEVAGEGGEARRVIEELDYLEPDTSRRSPRLYHRTRLRSKFSQRWSDISATLSSLRLPTLRSLYRPVFTGTPESTTVTPPSTATWFTRMSQRIAIPDKYRPSAPTFARLCGLFTLAGLVYILFALDLFPRRRLSGARFDPESVRKFVQENADPESIQRFLYHITSYDHVAGTEGDLFLTKWMEEQWREEGKFDDVALLPYYVYLNYPGERSVSIVGPPGKEWAAGLEEQKIYPDRQQTLAWHGHSRSGEAEGHLVYANGGSREDFAELRQHGVVTNGSIALVKYYGTQGDRALKIKAAEEAGCKGVLVYSDPSDVDERSPWAPPDDSLQRGGVSMMSWVIGDPLTPGFASTLDADRVSKDNNPGLPNIPSLPLSWRDAQHLLKSLQGHGFKVDYSWVHGSKNFIKDWFSGNVSSPGDEDGPIVHIKNENSENPLQQIWNLHGLIEGVETPAKKIIVGNHRDSWCYGAVDPGSGSAVMMEVIRIFGELRKLGWRPLRTIEFVSWDAEEYNLVGSTEYVEDHLEHLRANAVAYLNVDVGVYGGADAKFRAAGSPLMQNAIMHVIDRVPDPGSNNTRSILQKWNEANSRLEGLGAGSDYVAFQDMAGTSSIDFGFEGREHAYPYHSCYETFEWMVEFGDPGMQYHHTLAQIWALLILELADRPLLPYDLRTYADRINEYVTALGRDAAGTFAQLSGQPTASVAELKSRTGFDLAPLHAAARALAENAKRLHRFEDVWTSNVLGAGGGFETTGFAYKRLQFNERLARFDTDLLDPDGVPGREQFKHVIFGPQAWSGYDEAYFPAVRDAVERGDWAQAQVMVQKAAARIELAARNLVD